MTEKTITEFLSKDYKDFSFYTIEQRAIPSLVDGFKSSARKIIHTSSNIWKNGTEKSLKVFQLGGKVSSETMYAHGDVSLNDAIVNMAQKFKNNLPLLEEEGQFGSLRAPEAGAPRYIGTKLNKNFKLIYKDFDLLKYKEEDGYIIEPEYFLPIIPMVLINGSQGIAVGFNSNILNRNPIDIIENCLLFLKNKKLLDIKPFTPNFGGEYIRDIENHKRWIIRGKLEIVNTTTIKITELTPSMTYQKYEDVLDKLIEKKIIYNYEDNCKDSINYTIKFTRENLIKYTIDDLYKILKIEEAETERFITLDELGKLKIFESDIEILEYFINYRLSFYQIRKDLEISNIKNEIKILSNKGRFIKLFIDGKIDLKNKSKNEIIELLNDFDKIEDSHEYLLRMPIWSLSNDNFETIKKEFSTKKLELEILEKKEPTKMYIEDLEILKKKIKI